MARIYVNIENLCSDNSILQQYITTIQQYILTELYLCCLNLVFCFFLVSRKIARLLYGRGYSIETQVALNSDNFFSSRKFFAILRVDGVKITSSKNKIVEWNSFSSNKKSTLVNRAD